MSVMVNIFELRFTLRSNPMDELTSSQQLPVSRSLLPELEKAEGDVLVLSNGLRDNGTKNLMPAHLLPEWHKRYQKEKPEEALIERTLSASDDDLYDPDVVEKLVKSIPHHGGPCTIQIQQTCYAEDIWLRHKEFPYSILYVVRPGKAGLDTILVHDEMSYRILNTTPFKKVVLCYDVKVECYEIYASRAQPGDWLFTFDQVVGNLGEMETTDVDLGPHFLFSILE